jgi:hypothetical protein
LLQRRAIPWPWQRTKSNRDIDLGGGRFVPPEDLLEGHFRRIAQPAPPSRTPAQGQSAGHEVRVQVGADMSAAIRVVAPTLAPLTQVAEELAGRLISVKPTPQFRADLHRALEAELQRRLESDESSDTPPAAWTWAAAAFITFGIAGLVLWLLRRRN